MQYLHLFLQYHYIAFFLSVIESENKYQATYIQLQVQTDMGAVKKLISLIVKLFPRTESDRCIISSIICTSIHRKRPFKVDVNDNTLIRHRNWSSKQALLEAYFKVEIVVLLLAVFQERDTISQCHSNVRQTRTLKSYHIILFIMIKSWKLYKTSFLTRPHKIFIKKISEDKHSRRNC